MHGFMVDVAAGSRGDTTIALESALVHSAAIEQVKGMVMLTHQLDADAAFELLVGHSMITNTKLTTIVATVLDRVANRTATEWSPAPSWTPCSPTFSVKDAGCLDGTQPRAKRFSLNAGSATDDAMALAGESVGTRARSVGGSDRVGGQPSYCLWLLRDPSTWSVCGGCCGRGRVRRLQDGGRGLESLEGEPDAEGEFPGEDWHGRERCPD